MFQSFTRGTFILCLMLATTGAPADIVAEFDAQAAGVNATPDTIQPKWSCQSGSEAGMTNNGTLLLQDFSADDPRMQYCNYTSPVIEGLMIRDKTDYGIEFRVRPLADVPNLGNSHYGNIVLLWADDKGSYSATIDLDSDDSGPEKVGGIRSGLNSMMPIASKIDWTQPRAIFIGYTAADDRFEIFVDGISTDFARAADIARESNPAVQNRVMFGDATSGQPAPQSIDPGAEWYFVRLHDSAKLPGENVQRRMATSAAPAASPRPQKAQPGDNTLWLYGVPAKSEAETVTLIQNCKANGIGALLPSLSCGGNVIWKTDKAGYCDEFKPMMDAGFDGLESLIRNAHAAGIKVYPSVAVCPAGDLINEHPEWETRDRLGRPSSATTTAAISLAIPEARAAKIALVMDLVNDYEVDGVLLDYCRYPENTKTPEQAYGFYGYDAPLIEACQTLYGFDPRQEEIDSPNWTVFNNMRMETVTAFVREFRDAVKASGRDVRVGGFGDTDPVLEARMCGRDYVSWARRGLIDDFFLATYTGDLELMKSQVAEVRAAVGDKVVLYSALCTFQDRLKTEEDMKSAAIQQLDGGADGLWIYREDYLVNLNLWSGARAANDVATEP